MLLLSACTTSSGPTRSVALVEPEASSDPERAGCTRVAEQVDCPAGTTRHVQLGPMSEEGSMFCVVSCLRGDENHGPYLMTNISRPGSYRVEGQYLDGKRDGRWTTSGQHSETLEPMRVDETTYRDGGTYGMYRRWHPDGTLHEEGAYIGDDRDGAWATYAPDGTWVFRGTFDRSIPIGIHYERYFNGQLASQKAYDEVGRPHGKWCFWLSDGVEVDCFEIQFGTGEIRDYNRDGKMTHRVEMVDGKRHGIYVEYTHDGGRYEAHYAEGAQHGEESVFEGDCATRSVMWDQGQEHGPTFEADCDATPPIKVVEGENCRANPCGRWTMRGDDGKPTQIIEFSETGEVLGRVTYGENGEIDEFTSER